MNSARTSTRWGGQETINVAPGSNVLVAQFVDLDLLAPQTLSIALYALSDVPVAGLSTEFVIALGVGSTVLNETISVPVSDVQLPQPVILERAARALQVRARVFSVAATTKRMQVAALVAPIAPTWTTDLSCREVM